MLRVSGQKGLSRASRTYVRAEHHRLRLNVQLAAAKNKVAAIHGKHGGALLGCNELDDSKAKRATCGCLGRGIGRYQANLDGSRLSGGQFDGRIGTGTRGTRGRGGC